MAWWILAYSLLLSRMTGLQSKKKNLTWAILTKNRTLNLRNGTQNSQNRNMQGRFALKGKLFENIVQFRPFLIRHKFKFGHVAAILTTQWGQLGSHLIEHMSKYNWSNFDIDLNFLSTSASIQSQKYRICAESWPKIEIVVCLSGLLIIESNLDL